MSIKELILLFLVSLVAGGLAVRAGIGIYQTIKKRNRRATPEEQAAYRQKQHDMEPTPQELARRGRENAQRNECNRIADERRRIIESGSTQPMPAYPLDSSGMPLC